MYASLQEAAQVRVRNSVMFSKKPLSLEAAQLLVKRFFLTVFLMPAYVCMYVIYVCMYVCIYVRYICMYVRMYVGNTVTKHSMYVCMYVCISVLIIGVW